MLLKNGELAVGTGAHFENFEHVFALRPAAQLIYYVVDEIQQFVD